MSTLTDSNAFAQELIKNSHQTSSYQSKYFIPFIPDLGYCMRQLGVCHASDAALFLNQLRYWIKQGYGQVTKDGKRWIHNAYKKWVAEQFRSLSEGQFGDMVRHLARLGIIEKCGYDTLGQNITKQVDGWHPYKRTSWITLNVERLSELTGFLFDKTGESPETLPDAKIENRILVNCLDENTELRSPQSSIYKENSISTQEEPEAEFRKKDGEVSQENQDVCQPDEIDLWSEELPINTHYVVEPEKEPLTDNRDYLDGKSSAVPPPENLNPENKPNSVPEASFKKKPESSTRTEVKKQIWEIAPKQPYAVFLNWWADRRYKPQGGQWEVAATSNAYSEFYKDCDRTTIAIFPEFLEYMRTVAQNCNQQVANGIKAILPSCFVHKPEATHENVQQVMVNIEQLVKAGATVALPSNAATPACSQSISFDSAANAGIIQPLQEFAAITSTEAEAEIQASANEELLRILHIKQTMWINAPRLRDSIKRWVENTVGVVMTKTGPALEI